MVKVILPNGFRYALKKKKSIIHIYIYITHNLILFRIMIQMKI